MSRRARYFRARQARSRAAGLSRSLSVRRRIERAFCTGDGGVRTGRMPDVTHNMTPWRPSRPRCIRSGPSLSAMGVFHVDNPGGENMAMQRYLVRTDKLLSGEGTAVTTGARYRFAPDWFSVDLEDEGVELRRWLLDNDAQATLARDRRLHVPVSGAPQDSHGLDTADPALADLQPRQDIGRGLGVRVGVADTGIRLHKWLNGAFPARPTDWEPLDVDGDDVLDPQAGHGLFIAGLILQQAPSSFTLRAHSSRWAWETRAS